MSSTGLREKFWKRLGMVQPMVGSRSARIRLVFDWPSGTVRLASGGVRLGFGWVVLLSRPSRRLVDGVTDLSRPWVEQG